MNIQNSYSGSGTNIFLDLEIYNNKTTEQQAILKYSGNNLIDVQSHMWPYKFTLNTSNYPLYVPTLVNTFTPYNLDSNTQTIINNPNNYYMMDWTITVKFTDGSSKTTPILWEKYGFRQPFIEPLINNKYFWLDNSDQLCEFLTSAFERILGSNQVYFVKNADRWSLLINTKNTTLVSIHFNDAMKNLFPFNFVENNGILLKYKLQTLTTLTDSFYKITTSTTNNKLFPFDKINFKSQELNIPLLNSQEYNNNVTNYSASTILSYNLNITDISVLGTSITFNTETNDRCLSLFSEFPPSFTIVPYLITKSGQEIPVMIKPGDKLSFSMMFF